MALGEGLQTPAPTVAAIHNMTGVSRPLLESVDESGHWISGSGDPLLWCRISG